jgi:hypothetical protein
MDEHWKWHHPPIDVIKPPKFVYDEPTTKLHKCINFAESPDKHRPWWPDLRIVEMKCGLIIALTAHPKNKPPKLTKCEECYSEKV